MVKQSVKKILCLLLTFALVLCMSGLNGITAQAAGREDGTDYRNAKKLTLSTKTTDTISANKNKIYEFDLTTAGCLELAIAGTTTSHIYVYRSTNEMVKRVSVDTDSLSTILSESDFFVIPHLRIFHLARRIIVSRESTLL